MPISARCIFSPWAPGKGLLRKWSIARWKISNCFTKSWTNTGIFCRRMWTFGLLPRRRMCFGGFVRPAAGAHLVTEVSEESEHDNEADDAARNRFDAAAEAIPSFHMLRKLSAKNIHLPCDTEGEERLVIPYRTCRIAVQSPCIAVGSMETDVAASFDGEILKASTYA